MLSSLCKLISVDQFFTSPWKEDLAKSMGMVQCPTPASRVKQIDLMFTYRERSQGSYPSTHTTRHYTLFQEANLINNAKIKMISKRAISRPVSSDESLQLNTFNDSP